MNLLAIVLSTLLVHCHGFYEKNNGRKFPDDFIFGISTSAYQIEGGWDADGKSENIWDYLTHTNPDHIEDRSNGDVAADSYHNYHRDIEMIRELGLDMYRFSFSWTRILPTGFPNYINPAGVKFYNNYIDEMVKYNITPMATIYHWDMPQNLQELGGTANPLFAQWFEDYARVVFDLFGDRVKKWITINEPKQICYHSYELMRFAPVINSTGIGHYMCAKTIIMAHARAYHLYNKEFRSSQGGEIGYAVDVQWISPLTNSKEDIFATELKWQSDWALYSDPIFARNPGWSREISERVAAKSAAQGFPRSRLPDFSAEEEEYVHNTADFFAINHYSSYKAFASEGSVNSVPSLLDDIHDVSTISFESWSENVYGTMQAPDNFFNILKQLHHRYPNMTFVITETGTSTEPGLDDDKRVQVYRDNLESVLNALDAGLPIKGFLAWSLMDNFEWQSGYTKRFGLYEVDFEDPARTRTPKKSAFVYKQIVKTRTIDHDYAPPSRIMTIDV